MEVPRLLTVMILVWPKKLKIKPSFLMNNDFQSRCLQLLQITIRKIISVEL